MVRGRALVPAVAVGVGVLAALVLVAVLLRLTPTYLDHQPVVGALLLVGAILLVVVAVDLTSPLRRRGMWLLGAAACLGVTTVYLVDAAVGLPDGRDTGWWDSWVAVGVIAQAVYVVAVSVWLSNAPARARVSGAPAGASRPGRAAPARPASRPGGPRPTAR